ncbi:MAG: LamG-like jellyroll fold domain-containing protein, partial [Verrucomicrobiota bacterium]|nr:LamG-like jellyroll fold domain-containing protein [Verrucomicrobiota bacterium]
MKQPTLALLKISTALSLLIGGLSQAANNWTPAEIPTHLWFDGADASTITHSSNSISQWRDKSGNNRHANQGTAGSQPQLVSNALNGKSLLRFDGGDRLEFTGGFVPGDFVVLFKRTANNQPVVQSGTGASRRWVGYGGAIWSSHNRYSTNGYPLSTIQPDGAYGADYFMVFGTDSRWTGGLSANAGQNSIGRDTNGDIAEFVVFPNTLTDANRERVHGYLAHKWGQTAIIPGGNPYKTTAPLASTKANFVGREGTSAPYLDMRVEFRNGGSLLEVAATTSSFNVTGGTISNLTKVADGNYTFRLTPTAPGTVTLAMAAGVKDSENKDLGGGTGQVVFGQGGLYRPNDLLAYFDFDENTGNKAYNEGTSARDGLYNATLSNGATWATGANAKFGASAASFPTGSSARALVSPAIDLGGTNDAANFTISSWFKDLHPTSEGWRTLMRGQQGNHHVIIQNTNRVGVFHNWQGSFRPTASFDLTPAMTTTWRHLMAVSGGGVTTFYLDAVKMGTSDRQTGNNIYSVGAYQNGTQKFAQYLDDFRVYSAVFGQADAQILFNNGNGDLGPTSNFVNPTKATAASTTTLNIDFRHGGSLVAVTDLALTDFVVDNGSVSSLNNTGTGQYSVVVTPGSLRGLTKVTLKNGAAYDAQLRGSTKFEHTIDFVEAVTRYADLEGWWKFEDNLNDSSGNDRTGAHSGTNKYENLGSIGKFGNGLYLDGTGEHISITGYKGITGGAARTMAAWIKTDFSKAPILNWGNNAAGQKWTFRVQTDAGVSGAHRIEVNGGSIVGDTAVNDNRWHHVV